MQYVNIDIPYLTISDTLTGNHDIEKHIVTPFGSIDILFSNPGPGGKSPLSESVIKVETDLPAAASLNSTMLKGFAETIFALSYELARKALQTAPLKNFRIELNLFGPRQAIHAWRRSDSPFWEIEAAEFPSVE
jgi:hypothetical protein